MCSAYPRFRLGVNSYARTQVLLFISLTLQAEHCAQNYVHTSYLTCFFVKLINHFLKIFIKKKKCSAQTHYVCSAEYRIQIWLLPLVGGFRYPWTELGWLCAKLRTGLCFLTDLRMVSTFFTRTSCKKTKVPIPKCWLIVHCTDYKANWGIAICDFGLCIINKINLTVSSR